MSTINTNGLNVNYPVPGVNNNSQGFRDNFASIKTNLDVAGNEITDLQTNVVLKSALQNSVLNNDMANTLISNAAVRSFRHPTYNLGNSLSGTVLVDVSLGDVQIGTVTGNVSFEFGSWAPSGTQSNVELQLTVSNPSAVITFPEQVVQSNGNYGTTLLENYANVANTATVTVPYGSTQLDYVLSSVDCGDTITITPYNRPYQTTQVQQRLVPPTGFQGDVAGTVAIDPTYLYVCTSDYDSIANTVTITNTVSGSNIVTINNTAKVTANDPIILTGNIGGLVANTVYYVASIVNAGAPGNISVSATRTGGTAGANVTLTTASGTITATSFNGSDIWKRIALTSW